MLSPEHQTAIVALARYVSQQRSSHRTTVLTSTSDIKALEEDLVDILQERRSRFKRFFSAKRHRSELHDVVNQLENATVLHWHGLFQNGVFSACI